MKKLLLIAALLAGCRNNEKKYRYHQTVIVGNDTISPGNYDKVHGHYEGHGHNDTMNKIFYDTIWIQPVHDTIYAPPFDVIIVDTIPVSSYLKL